MLITILKGRGLSAVPEGSGENAAVLGRKCGDGKRRENAETGSGRKNAETESGWKNAGAESGWDKIMESGEGIQKAEHATILRFDRDGAGSGAEALCRMENGRARLEWRFHLAAYSGEQARRLLLPRDAAEFAPGTEMAEQFIRLWIRDREGNSVLECIHLLREEEPLESILPQPRIWNGMDSPYLYETEAALEDRNGNCLDRVRGFLPLRQVECRNREGRTQVFLNGENFERRMVRYALPETGNPAQRQRQILEDLRRLQKLGANCLLLEEPAGTQGKAYCPSVFCGGTFVQLCDRLGFLVFTEPGQTGGAGRPDVSAEGTGGPGVSAEGTAGSDIPVFRGIRNSFFFPGREAPAPLYFKYRAKWSREPFVYLVPESLRRLDDGNYTVCCYSNCDKVALYADGRLFEFKTGELTFFFYEIPCGKPSIMLTAEGDGCSHSISIHKSFTKQTPFNDIFPLE